MSRDGRRKEAGRGRKPSGANRNSDAIPGDRGKTSDAELPCKPTPGLYLVATPIGNLRDITLRALDVLAGVDLIACEDTRVTGRLLNAYGVDRPMLPYHDHNAGRIRPKLIAKLEAGASVALVSDAGTPLISDPGYKLVSACIAAGVAVSSIPGPSAALTALQLAGLASDRFLFAGFPPTRVKARREAFAGLAGIDATLIFYEAAPRLAASLADMASILGPRAAAVAREMTKRYEEVRRGTLQSLAAAYADAPPPKGEIVVVVDGPGPPPAVTEDELDARLKTALAGASVRDAAAMVAAETGISRRRVYARALALADGG